MPSRHAPFRQALTIALIYLVFSVTWVIGTDRLLVEPLFELTPEQISVIASIKGTAFVIVSALLIYSLVRRTLVRLMEGEAAKRAAEERLRMIAANIEEVVWLSDGKIQKILYISPSYEAIWKRPSRELCLSTESLISSIAPEDKQNIANRLQQLQLGDVLELEYRIVWPDGSRRWIWNRAVPVRDAFGVVTNYVGIAQDVTDRVEAGRRYRSLFENMLEGYAYWRMIYDEKGALADFILLAVNDSFYRLTRLSDVIGHKLTGIAPGIWKHISSIYRNYDDGENFNRAVQFEFFMEETSRWYLISIYCPECNHLVMIFDDVTERKEHEQELRNARAAAEVASEAKSRFIATMSHELRTPLNALLGFVDLILTGTFGSVDRRYLEHAEDARLSGAHLLALINDILDLSKIKAGKMALSLEPMSVPALIESSIRLVNRSLRENGLTLETSIADGLPKVLADDRAVQQIMINLLSNAVKFTPGGGLVTVAARRKGDGVDIVVSDTGVGIDKDQIARALEPFEQVDNHYSRSRNGTGLGLSIVQGLVTLHGGRLTIDSRPGEGTAVTVHLRAA